MLIGVFASYTCYICHISSLHHASIHASLYPSIHPSIHPCMHASLSFYPPICGKGVGLPVRPSISPSILPLATCLSVCLSIYTSCRFFVDAIHLSVCFRVVPTALPQKSLMPRPGGHQVLEARALFGEPKHITLQPTPQANELQPSSCYSLVAGQSRLTRSHEHPTIRHNLGFCASSGGRVTSTGPC